MAEKIYFRADASPEIGYGHFIRCLALAGMLKDDFECVFFTQTPSEYQRQEVAKICRLVELPAGKEKFNTFLESLSGEETVVLDNYFFSTEYQRKIRDKGCGLVCIDDMHDKHYVADVVVNHGIENPELFDVEPYTRLCLGFNWALLRSPFLSAQIPSHEKGHWLVSFGGSDYHNLTEKFLTTLEREEEITGITVILGDGYLYHSTLKFLSKTTVLTKLTAEEMRNEMIKAEYALLPSSGICIEALSCGCKVISGYYVENQKEFYENLKKTDKIYPLGDLLMIDKDSFKIKDMMSMAPPDTGFKDDIRDNYIELFKGIR